MKDYSRYLLSESPISLYPKLALALGSDKAIIVQQIRYWMDHNSKDPTKQDTHFINDRWWTYNTFEQWQSTFMWLGLRTIKSMFASLKKQGILLQGFYHRDRSNRTAWYSIDFDRLDEVVDQAVQQWNEQVEECAHQKESKTLDFAPLCKNGTIPHSAKPALSKVPKLHNDLYTKTTSETTSQNPKDSVKCSLATEVENSENFEFENGGAKPPLAPAPSVSLDATQGQAELATEGEMGEEVLRKLRKRCKVGKHLEQKLLANPKAASFALEQLEYAISDGLQVDNPAGFFHKELKASIKRRNPHHVDAPKPQKNDQQAASTTPKVEIPYPVTIGGSEEAKPLEKVRRLDDDEFRALEVGEYFYMSDGNLPKDYHGCGYGSRSPILWLYKMAVNSGVYSDVIDVATGKKIKLDPIVMTHGSGKGRLGYTDKVYYYKPKSTFCA